MNDKNKKVLSICIWSGIILLTICLSLLKKFINFWQQWEHISVLSTFCFNVILLVLFFSKKIDSKINKGGVKAGYILLLFVFPAAFLAILNLSYVLTVVEFKDIFVHVTLLAVTSIFLFYTIGDYITYKHFKNTEQQNEKHEYWTNLIHLDVPFLISFLILSIYYFIQFNTYNSLPDSNRIDSQLQLQAFIGGASAFQLILQNTVYTLKTNIF